MIQYNTNESSYHEAELLWTVITNKTNVPAVCTTLQTTSKLFKQSTKVKKRNKIVLYALIFDKSAGILYILT